VVGGFFQHIDHICFCINREEMNPELLFEVFPGLDGEKASVRFLIKYVFRPLGGTTAFEEHKSPKNPLLFIVELLWGQADVERAGVQESMAIVTFSTKVQRTGELGTDLSRRRNSGGETLEEMVQTGEVCLV